MVEGISDPPKKRPPKLIPVKHRWLDQWLVAKGEPLKRLVNKTIVLIDHHETATKARERTRKLVDKRKHELMAEVVVSNLAYSVLNPSESGGVAVNLHNGKTRRSRYDNPAVSPRTLRPLTNNLSELDISNRKRPGVVRGEKTSISPTEWWKRKVAEEGITFADFGRDPAQELIILNRNSRAAFKPFSSRPSDKKKERVEYQETAHTAVMREQMKQVNHWLAQADISFVDDGCGVVDPYDRIMRRMFVITGKQKERFDQSGRLFGGFWQGLKSSRRKGIRINGEFIVDLDFSSMFTRLAYAEVKAVPPSGDLYAIPGLEGYRSGVKMAINAFLFATGTKQFWPAEMGVGVGNDDEANNGLFPALSFDARLPQGWTVKRTRAAILNHHPALVEALERGLGYHLMYRESEVLIAIMERLMILDVPALGLHDGVLVPLSRAVEVEGVMEEVSHRLVGVPLVISRKTMV